MPKVAFVQKSLYEKVSVHFLAGALKAGGIDYDLFIYDAEPDFFQALAAYRPDVVAWSLYLGEEQFAFRILKWIKRMLPRAVTVVGGPFTLIYPETVLRPEIDFVLQGDGEYTLPDFVRRISAGQPVDDVPGLCRKSGSGELLKSGGSGLVDVSKIPGPDRDLYYKYDALCSSPTKLFIASRGCPYSCSFCYNTQLSRYHETPYWRVRPVDDVLAEIRYVRDTWGLEWVHFQDGTFNANRPWLREFCEKYSRSGLPRFMINARVEGITPEIVEMLAGAGCDRITFGVQSGNPDIRQRVAGRPMENRAIVGACRLCRQNGIRYGIDIIFGWPGETPRQAMDTIELCREVDADAVSSNVLIFYPGLAVTSYAAENGFIAHIPGLTEVNNLDQNQSLLLSRERKFFINLDKLFMYFIRYPKWEPLWRLLLKLPPNKAFVVMKNLHFLIRSFKYDKNKSKVRILYDYLRNCFHRERG